MEVDAGDHVVLIAKDSEGNGFSSLGMNGFSVGFAEKDGHYYEYHEQEEGEDPPSGDPCICLWP
jgi:hypothetical protein